tara:strand:+ start:184 stop:450 length:267 start_codon:yes stop_codon:yes gene_type:complete
MSKEDLINFVLARKVEMSNPGTQPTVAAIKEKAQELIDFINNPNPIKTEVGLIAIVAPDDNLTDEFFKGWKTTSFERLALEIANVGNN